MSKEQTDLRQLQSARIMMEFGVRALSRTAFEGSEEATAFRNLGDTILANEGDVHGINIFKDVILSALDEAIARRASPSPAGGVQGVTVKALEWTEEDMDGNTATWWSAACATTRLAYEVRVTSRGTTRARMVGEDWTDFPGSPAAAKAAAQSDYEQRILSALSSQAQTTGGE